MGFLDSVKSWLRSEAAEAKDLGEKTKSRLETDLDRREAEMNLTPQERMERLQEQIEDGSSFEAIQDKIEGREALADATADVTGLDQKARGVDDDIMDLDSEEIIPPDNQPPNRP